MADILRYDLIDAIRICFVTATAAILIAHSNPAIRQRFFAYGARASVVQRKSQTERLSQSPTRAMDSFLDSIAGWQVPHNWFISFYVTSTMLSLFWLMVLPAAQPVLSDYVSEKRSTTPAIRQTIAYFFMSMQGFRRLTECILLTTPSKSSMWIGHWLMGLGFYIGMSIAIFVEGLKLDQDLVPFRLRNEMIDLRAAVCAVLFMLFSLAQNGCHRYLASLKLRHSTSNAKLKRDATDRYQVPNHPLFAKTLTPHYLFECLIYLDLAVLAAPAGQLLNVTILCAAGFVVVNLGVTAVGTHKWYADKFGPESVRGRWAMIPFCL